MTTMRIVALSWVVGLVLGLPVLAQSEEAKTARIAFEIKEQPLDEALTAFARQAQVQILRRDEEVSLVGLRAPAILGEMSVREALERLLANSGLTYRFVNERTVRVGVKPVAEAAEGDLGGVRVAQVDRNGETAGSGVEEPSPSQGAGQGEDAKPQTVGDSQEEEDPERSGIPEILVTGSKLGTLNMDIRRTEDDVQPYVVMSREEIEQSGATNLEEFFKNELTMSTGALFSSLSPDPEGNSSRVDLRGLGTDETLILVDGRRIAGLNVSGTPGQPDINAIPLSAIERIEVLPTTASGIYGGGATGGVINIVLRRDYTGLETKLSYGNVFKSDAKTRRLDLSAGWSPSDGKTNVMISGSLSDASPLLVRDREFIQDGRRRILANRPDYLGFGLPVGATTNIRSATGANLSLKDGTPLNSPITFVPPGYPGTTVDGGAALVANAGRYNLELADTAQNNQGGRQALLNHPTVASAMATIRREFTPDVQAFLEVATSANRGYFANSQAFTTASLIAPTAPNNPFQQPIRVAAPTIGINGELRSESETDRAVIGVVVSLPRQWRAASDFSWSRSSFSFSVPSELSDETIAAISSGSLDVLRDLTLFPVSFEDKDEPRFSLSSSDATLRDVALRLAGPLPWRFPGGNVSLSTNVEHREEVLVPARQQLVDSAYLELRLPMFSAQNLIRGVRALEFQLAARGDSYEQTDANGGTKITNRHSSVDPTIGVRYEPFAGMMLRASYGTGYLPPSILDLMPGESFIDSLGTFGITDPLRDNELLGDVIVISGGSPELRPEQSESKSVGFVLSPAQLSTLRVSIDWTKIQKHDNVSFLNVYSQEGLNELLASFPSRITRAPAEDGSAVGSIVAIDSSLINLALLRSEAIDFSIDYGVETSRFGKFESSLDATRLISLSTQTAPGSSVVESAGALIATIGTAGGVKWRANASLRWSYSNWSLGWRTRFFDSYFVNTTHSININQGSATVPNQIYHDVFGTYSFGSSTMGFGLLEDTQIHFGVINVFDRRPPIDVGSGLSRAFYSPLGDPRLANYQVSLRRSFGGAK